ncbi:hypothetical protein OG979_36450 [Actinomadura citrea]|uniref:hypothetical protein n=1 Tax=Actinomadura citrea TaxID=46158 RepID=UPI002E286D00|nr:hypothetical protein [Actinomadura citrea]
MAGDYVRTHVDLATMEGANESGRAAVNALLDGLKKLDAQRYRSGLNLFDTLPG